MSPHADTRANVPVRRTSHVSKRHDASPLSQRDNRTVTLPAAAAIGLPPSLSDSLAERTPEP
jgi:hypothetical protein